jgi:hypothetical protein
MIPNTERIYRMKFSTVYPLYIKKVERKNRTKAEVDTLIYWLTGYDADGLKVQIDSENDFESFFNQCPHFNPNAHIIKGLICGYRVEDITDPIVQKVRYMDKLIDELAKGKSMEKIISRGYL